jgi:hypothetical protein
MRGIPPGEPAAAGDTERMTRALTSPPGSGPGTPPTTVLDALVEALADTARFNANDVVAPAVIVWGDVNREWAPVIPRLRSILPLVTLGDFDPATRSGPTIWLRAVIERLLPDVSLPEGVPIVYLPGLDSNTFRSAASVPKDLEPLVELRYRGVVFRHPNGRDWTPRGFLQARLDLNVREDHETARALQAALERLLDEPVASLARRPVLDASVFHAIVTPDPIRKLLAWMNAEPAVAAQRQTDAQHWRTFRTVTKTTYGLDPERDGALSAAERLIDAAASPSDPWNGVWDRFREAPGRYPHLPDLLRRAAAGRPGLFSANERVPTDNEREEEQLQGELLGLAKLAAGDARARLKKLEADHGHRRHWVWADLGAAPLATALGPLLRLVEHTSSPLGSGSPSEIAQRYADGGWWADRLALLVMASSADRVGLQALAAAVNAIYRPWLEEAAQAFQAAVRREGLPPAPTPWAHEPGRCLLFTDGLRFDVAQDLVVALRDSGHEVGVNHAFGAVPGVTATAKPATSPVRGGLEPGAEFCVTWEGTTVNAGVLRRAMESEGFQILEGDDTGDPSGAAWTELGNLDAIGHADGVHLAHRIGTEVRTIADRVRALLQAGWREVVVVTDHGWLLLPGGLPSVSLKQHLTLARKGRCARVKDGASVEFQTLPWTFDKGVRIAVAPGIGVFVAGKEYEHGGLSVQESVLPVLRIKADPSAAAATCRIAGSTWTGLRLRVDVEGAPSGAQIDLRTKAGDAETSIATSPRDVNADGQASLIVEDDAHLRVAAFVVLLAPDGRVLAQQMTVVGEG